MSDQVRSTTTEQILVLIRYADEAVRLEGMGGGEIGVS